MTRVNWLRILAAVLGGSAVLWLLGGDRSTAQIAEGAMGVYPVPPTVGMTQPGSGLRLALGPVEAAQHEAAEGYFNVGRFSISVPPNGIPADILRQHQGVEVEILIRRVEPRKQERLER